MLTGASPRMLQMLSSLSFYLRGPAQAALRWSLAVPVWHC